MQNVRSVRKKLKENINCEFFIIKKSTPLVKCMLLKCMYLNPSRNLIYAIINSIYFFNFLLK